MKILIISVFAQINYGFELTYVNLVLEILAFVFVCLWWQERNKSSRIELANSSLEKNFEDTKILLSFETIAHKRSFSLLSDKAKEILRSR